MNDTQHGVNAEHFDVLIIGAGISGIGAAHHLTQECPDHTYLVLEAQQSFGGTWLTHRYPGVRSDSDLYTYGYGFKPWIGPPIATADEIRGYMSEVISDSGIDRHIRYGHEIRGASWSSATNLWTVEATRSHDGSVTCFTTRFLWMCQGYYRHSQGYTPTWPQMEAFRGVVVHPQSWPEKLDYSGKRVVIIGSGATAVTLIPSLADQCAHVTMLQRSPTYFNVGRNSVPMADELRELGVDETWIHEIVRRKLLRERQAAIKRAHDHPESVREELLQSVKTHLAGSCDIDPHFSPRYRPWTQRIAFDPDGAMFRSIREGKASVVTGDIECFVERGIALKSGEVLEADIVITATGFNLSVMGDIRFTVDGEPLALKDTVAYRGMMLTGVPNFAWVFGYFRGSWTLRLDLIAGFVCRLLRHMRQDGAQRVLPQLRPEDRDMDLRPWMEPEDFNPGYLARGMHLLPRLGTKPEWRISQDYPQEKKEFAEIDLTDRIFSYTRE
jgi:cation diffusion facilitator CzcD-associated flavoprotein CzcO